MGELTVIRKRFIPFEEVDISKDNVVKDTEDCLITKWLPIRPRKNIGWGISFVNMKDNYKYSRFYSKDGKFMFWYCDIIEITKVINGCDRKYIFSDLLIDVIIYPDGTYEVKDLDELELALQDKLITKEQAELANNAMKRLVASIKSGDFPPKEFDYSEFEKNTYGFE